MDQAYTYTPNLITHPDGQTSIDFDSGVLEGSAGREEVNTHHQQHPHEDL